MCSTTDSPTRCVVCGSTRDIERHHLLPLGQHQATVPLCRRHHREQTDRQRAAGLLDPRTVQALPADTAKLAAAIESLAGLAATLARHHRDAAAVSLIERNRRELLRVLTLASDSPPGLIGPRPTRPQRPTTRPVGRHEPGGHVIDSARIVMGAVVDVLEDISPGLPEQARRIIRDPDRLKSAIEGGAHVRDLIDQATLAFAAV
jgi:hypothetical protein